MDKTQAQGYQDGEAIVKLRVRWAPDHRWIKKEHEGNQNSAARTDTHRRDIGFRREIPMDEDAPDIAASPGRDKSRSRARRARRSRTSSNPPRKPASPSTESASARNGRPSGPLTSHRVGQRRSPHRANSPQEQLVPSADMAALRLSMPPAHTHFPAFKGCSRFNVSLHCVTRDVTRLRKTGFLQNHRVAAILRLQVLPLH